MGREILFRGQTRKTGEKVYMDGRKVPGNWVYGGICSGKGDFSIIYATMDEEKEIPVEKHVVYTETVGQYTGLKDKNGKMIFEGDILKYKEMQFEHRAVVCFGKYEYDRNKNAGFYLHWYYGSCVEYYRKDIGYWSENRVIEVIGNIHDNPELLEVSHD